MDEAGDLFVDGVDRFQGAIVGRSDHLAAIDLVQGLVGDPCIRDRGGLHHLMRQHVLRKQDVHEPDHLGLRTVRRLVTGYEVAEPLQIHGSSRIRDRLQNPAEHQQELAHRHHVEHLRVHGDQD